MQAMLEEQYNFIYSSKIVYIFKKEGMKILEPQTKFFWNSVGPQTKNGGG